MFRYTSNGNYNVREDFAKFSNDLTSEQLNTRIWAKTQVTLPKIECLRQSIKNDCNYTNIKKIEDPCPKEDGFEVCSFTAVCNPDKITPNKYCTKTGPKCNSNQKIIEGNCCPKLATHFGMYNNKKYYAWKY